MTQVSAKLPRGMRDILPQQMILRKYVMDVVEKTFQSFGFEPLETPAVELREVLMGKYGEDAERLIYDVQHEGGKEKLALRYDLTVPLTRMIAMNPTLRMPFKRYQIAPVWRAERPAKGRYRQFYQCDVDIVGSDSMMADAEILMVIHDVLQKLGFAQYKIQLNHRDLVLGLGEYSGVEAHLASALYRSIDKLGKIGSEAVQQEMLTNGIPTEVATRLLDLLAMQGSGRELIADMRRRLSDVPRALKGLHDLEQLITFAGELGLPEECYSIEFAMVRGLSYYTGPIYETEVKEPRIGSITGGGRYDELIGLFTDRSLPVTGTALGIERIIDVIEELNLAPTGLGRTTAQVLVTVFDETSRPHALRLSANLRKAGFNVETWLGEGKLGKQIRYASEKGVPFLTILGPDEAAAGQVTLRDLDRTLQATVALDEASVVLWQWQRERSGL